MSFARKSDVRPNRISQILAGKRAVTGDSALRFGRWFDMDPQFRLNIQRQCGLCGCGAFGRSKGARLCLLQLAANRVGWWARLILNAHQNAGEHE